MPYVIVVYDVEVLRVNKIRIFLKSYLNWIQNSVFEGELTRAQMREITDGIKHIIDAEKDFVVIYVIQDKKFLNIDEYGKRKGFTDNII